MKINLLDCTIRDGGYYNNWDFSPKLVQNYLNSMAASGIEYVELGFRFINKNVYMGPCAYTTDSYINSLKIPSSLKIGIMINAKDLISSNLSTKNLLKVFFNDFKNTKISFVRFACHSHEVKKIINFCKELKNFKIKVIINLMQISELKNTDINNVVKLLNKSRVDYKDKNDFQPELDFYPFLFDKSEFIICPLATMIIEASIMNKKVLVLAIDDEKTNISPSYLYKNTTYMERLTDMKNILLLDDIINFDKLLHQMITSDMSVDRKALSYYIVDDGQLYSDRIATICNKLTLN